MSAGQARRGPLDAGGAPAAKGLRVRPYALTGGRTRPVRDLPVEALVTALDPRGRAGQGLPPEQRRMLGLAVTPVSVAEIAAHLHTPLGVTRVLVGDLLAAGLLELSAPATPTDRPDVHLLERVLHGLHAL